MEDRRRLPQQRGGRGLASQRAPIRGLPHRRQRQKLLRILECAPRYGQLGSAVLASLRTSAARPEASASRALAVDLRPQHFASAVIRWRRMTGQHMVGSSGAEPSAVFAPSSTTCRQVPPALADTAAPTTTRQHLTLVRQKDASVQHSTTMAAANVDIIGCAIAPRSATSRLHKAQDPKNWVPRPSFVQRLAPQPQLLQRHVTMLRQAAPHRSLPSERHGAGLPLPTRLAGTSTRSMG